MSNALSNVNSLRHLAFTAYSLSFVIVVVVVVVDGAGDATATATVFVFIALMLVGDSKAALTLMTNTLGQEIR